MLSFQTCDAAACASCGVRPSLKASCIVSPATNAPSAKLPPIPPAIELVIIFAVLPNSAFTKSSPTCKPFLLACFFVACFITGLYSFSPTPNALAPLYALFVLAKILTDLAAIPAGKKKDIEYGKTLATSVAQKPGSAN